MYQLKTIEILRELLREAIGIFFEIPIELANLPNFCQAEENSVWQKY